MARSCGVRARARAAALSTTRIEQQQLVVSSIVSHTPAACAASTQRPHCDGPHVVTADAARGLIGAGLSV